VGLAGLGGGGDLLRRAGPLERVMGVMEDDFQGLSGALLREDYAEAAAAARRLADHPTPSLTEKLSLLSRVGLGAGELREYDERTRGAARDIAEAADAEALERMTEGFHRLVDSCLACHRRFGDRRGTEVGE
ncbi:MAG: hypothetical protein ACLFRB_04590, partial [Thiohalorhabdus sp.]|uniref:hypothetical protein n=1 Tax=Thiohalorhabdus sp. TaxID=3094134 RepID=UPI003980CAB2